MSWIRETIFGSALKEIFELIVDIITMSNDGVITDEELEEVVEELIEVGEVLVGKDFDEEKAINILRHFIEIARDLRLIEGDVIFQFGGEKEEEV